MTANAPEADRTRPVIRWHAESFDPAMASVRLRVLQPMAALRERGYTVSEAGGEASDFDMVVFSKSDSPEALALAEAASIGGKPVIYDVCDNIFEKPSIDDRQKQRKERAQAIMRLARAVTCTTPQLADLLTRFVPEIAGKVEIVPDALEEPGRFAQAPSPGDRIALWRLRGFLRRHRGALHLVWFGKCKKGYAGIEHLRPVVERLERLAPDQRATLTVISNRRVLYLRNARHWRIPKHYLPWSLATFERALRMHDAAVIPVELNDYTIGKTINRPATALMAGLGVIADSIPAYEELRPFIALDEWDEGLERYRAGSTATDDRIVAAQAHLRSRYSLDVITNRWIEVIERCLAQSNAPPAC